MAGGILGVSVGVGIAAFVKERMDEKKEKPSNHHQGFYEHYVKRPLDATLATGATLVFSPILAGTAVLVKCKLGSPVLFTQERPGKDEKIFKLYKFRTMTDERDEEGELLPDEDRLTDFGKKLRSTSLDELPELLNIIKGDMAVVGPRPLLVRDMVFMSDKQRLRHKVRPGLSGLAQVSGRNEIPWEYKLEFDIKYTDDITYLGDVNLIIATIENVIKKRNIVREGTASDMDYCDWLLEKGKVTKIEYEKKLAKAEDVFRMR